MDARILEELALVIAKLKFIEAELSKANQAEAKRQRKTKKEE